MFYHRKHMIATTIYQNIRCYFSTYCVLSFLLHYHLNPSEDEKHIPLYPRHNNSKCIPGMVCNNMKGSTIRKRFDIKYEFFFCCC